MGGSGGACPPRNLRYLCLAPRGGSGGLRPPGISVNYPCLASAAAVPCPRALPPIFFVRICSSRILARMARILMIFGPFESHRRQRKFEKISNERKIIESIESIDSIERSRDRSDRSTAAVFMMAKVICGGNMPHQHRDP